MKFFRMSVVAGLACVFASAAMADEVDFYQFRTTHSKDANSKATFTAEVLQTSVSDSSINDSNEHKCNISPATPQNFSCKVRGEWLWLSDSIESAKLMLTKGYALKDDEIVEAKKKSIGVYQFVLKNDRVFHVVIKAPSVVDDSMECEVAYVPEKARAIVRCRSEFYPEQRFEVRDVPFVMDREGYTYFGAGSKEADAVAVAKAQEIVAGIARLKKLKTLSDTSAIFNVGFALTSEHRSMVAYNVSYTSGYYRNYYTSTSVAEIELRGKVQYVHRGLEGRKGD